MRPIPAGALAGAAIATVAGLLACRVAPARAADAAPPVLSPSGAGATSGDARVATGAALFAKYCALCHGPEARGYAADNAPSLVSPQFLSAADDAYLTASIAFGRPGTSMAAYSSDAGGPLGEREIGAIVAFLRSRGPAAQPLPAHAVGDAALGQVLYTENCERCHGDRTDPGDVVQLSNPRFLSLASDAYLHDAISRGREGTRMEPFAGKLNERQIAAVVAYLRSWASPVQPLPPIRKAATAAPVPEGPIVLNPKGKPPTFNLRDSRFVPAAEVKQALEEKRRIVIVDARPPSDWLVEHIPGAISLPYYDSKALDRIPNDGTWVVAYCACPHHASGEVVDELRRRGYPHTAVLDEGILVWRDLGYPVAGSAAESDAKPPDPGRRETARMRAHRARTPEP